MVKIERSFPPPVSLKEQSEKKDGSYTGFDVIQRLRADFHNKCYICELKGLQDPQVEHLLPHKNGKDKQRKFDWENLFWVCGHCNGVKNQKKYEKGILDCCKEDPEKAMIFRLQENVVSVCAVSSKDARAQLAAQLVEEVFQVQNTGMRVYKSEMRLRELQKEMNVLYTKLKAYKEKPESKLIQRTLKALLKKETAFARFKRCYVREHFAEFLELWEYVISGADNQ